jgi:hypothetical protein
MVVVVVVVVVVDVKALDYFMRAHQCKENFKSNALWIAHTYSKMKNKTQAKAWYKIAIKMPSMCDLDRQVTNEARTLLNQL